MSDIIQLLPDTVANQIAAGEVIQRPASVVKELVENAIDAGATMINVITMDSGRTSIQVIDNGKGMSETDARLSFERHATSKIRKAADLFDLHTMGFRGEALPSIAAVAQVDLRTRQETDDLGTHLSLTASKVTSQEPCACAVGSNFTVENLFFNVPVRRKFLKSNTTELSNITTAFERIVLVNPNISFTLKNNATDLFSLRACGLRQRIVDVFGKKINPMLLPVDVNTSLCKLSGFVGKPESARKKGAQQFFFVNGRYMKHPYFNRAVMSAFDRLIPQGEQVPYFLYFEVAPENIDVNIHPTKTEIKFENEQAIWQIVAAGVKETIGMFHDVSTLDFDTQDRPDIPVFNASQDAPAMPQVQYNSTYNPFDTSSQAHTPKSSPASSATPDGWEQLYEGLGKDADPQTQLFTFADEDETVPSSIGSTQPAASPVEEKSPVHYQYKGRYVMTAVKSGLMIIDQHRAHVRIRYDQYLKALRARKGHAQKVLFPEVIHLSASERVVFGQIADELTDIGFDFTDLGAGAYSVSAVPAGLEGLNHNDIVHDMLTTADEKRSSSIDDINHRVALSLARHAAVAYGEVLTNEEMESLVNDLFASTNFNYAPDGKKILAMLKQTEIEHLLA